MADEESKVLDPETLRQLYWGDQTPGTWNTCEAIGAEYGMDADEVATFMDEYNIPRRTIRDRALIIVWRILVDKWNLKPGEHLDYKPDPRIDFWIKDEEIGIYLDEMVQPREILGRHLGPKSFFSICPNNLEWVADAVHRIAERYGIKKRMPDEREEGVDVW